MKPKFSYHGDVNIECGGYFLDKSNWLPYGYATVIRVMPISDCGGPDNLFWSDELTVNKPKLETLASALECCGFKFADDGETIVGNDCVISPCDDYYTDVVIDCLIAYGAYDQDYCFTVQVGAKLDNNCSEYQDFKDKEPDYKIRSNASLYNFVKKTFCK